MKRGWINATIAALVGAMLAGLGTVGLFHGSLVGVVLTPAGLFLLLSAYRQAGFTIKNPGLQRAAKVFTYVVVGGAISVSLLAGVIITTRTGEYAFARLVQQFREHPGSSIVLIVGFCWLLMIRKKSPKALGARVCRDFMTCMTRPKCLMSQKVLSAVNERNFLPFALAVFSALIRTHLLTIYPVRHHPAETGTPWERNQCYQSQEGTRMGEFINGDAFGTECSGKMSWRTERSTQTAQHSCWNPQRSPDKITKCAL